MGTQAGAALAAALKRVDPFYLSRAWRALRAEVLARDRWRCVVCGTDVSQKGAARVDHIKPRRGRPDLELDPSNCRTLCVLHDAQAHRERQARRPVAGRIERFVLGVGVDGWPIEPNDKLLADAFRDGLRVVGPCRSFSRQSLDFLFGDESTDV